MTPQGYSLCLVFLKLFERVYAPLTAGLLRPVPATANSNSKDTPNLTASISASSDDLDQLLSAVGLKLAA